jgi:8-oxo-dGTP pyrophosphatase MutT (NUDIX family)
VRPDDVRRALIELPPLPYDPRSLLLPDARDAAVLVALRFDVRGPVAYIVERSSGMRDHAGELGFFGGKLDDGETAEEAALREAGEEAGLEPGEVELLGRLSPVPVITRKYLLHPFVAELRSQPRLASSEHVALFEVELWPWLAGEQVIPLAPSLWRGLELSVPHFTIAGRIMYGASAVILFELLSRLAGDRLRTELVKDRPWGKRYEAEER